MTMPKSFRACCVLPEGQVDEPLVVVGMGIPRVQLDGFPVILEGTFMLAQSPVGRAPVVVHLGVLGA